MDHNIGDIVLFLQRRRGHINWRRVFCWIFMRTKYKNFERHKAQYLCIRFGIVHPQGPHEYEDIPVDIPLLLNTLENHFPFLDRSSLSHCGTSSYSNFSRRRSGVPLNNIELVFITIVSDKRCKNCIAARVHEDHVVYCSRLADDFPRRRRIFSSFGGFRPPIIRSPPVVRGGQEFSLHARPRRPRVGFLPAFRARTGAQHHVRLPHSDVLRCSRSHCSAPDGGSATPPDADIHRSREA